MGPGRPVDGLLLRTVLLGTAVLGIVSGAGGCNSAPDVKPSPLPPGYFERPDAVPPQPLQDREGTDLDETLAVVEGRPIFRRRLVREMGGRPKGMDDERFERQIRTLLKERVRQELFVNEAKRHQLRVPVQALDEFVQEQAQREVDKASKAEGRPVTFAEFLEDRGITAEEYRQNLERQLMYEIFIRKILDGIGGARPQVGMEVSPAEIRRIYRDHPGAFDLKRAVKLTMFQIPLTRYTERGLPLAEAEEAALQDARALAQGWRSGEEPEALGRRFDLDRGRGDWIQYPDLLEEGNERVETVFGKAGAAWIFDPARRARDAAVQADAPGPRVVGILEVQAPRARDWDEVSGEIVAIVRRARQLRVEAELLLNILGDRSIVTPSDVADEIAYDARELLRKLDEDPVMGAARFQ
jgi:hypothetical protein